MMQPILPIFCQKKRRFSKGALLLFRLQGLQIRLSGQGNRLVNESRGCTVFLMC